MEYRAFTIEPLRRLGHALGMREGWLEDDEDEWYTEEEWAQVLEEGRRQDELIREVHAMIIRNDEDQRLRDCEAFKDDIEGIVWMKVMHFGRLLSGNLNPEAIEKQEEEQAEAEAALVEDGVPEGFAEYWFETTGEAFPVYYETIYMNPHAASELLLS